jgi:hypothetical protein
MANANLSDLITPSEAAALRAVSRQAIDDLMRRGKLQTWEIGGPRKAGSARGKKAVGVRRRKPGGAERA